MRNRGIITIISIEIISLALWLLSKTDQNTFNFFQTLTQIFAILGITTISIQYILASRLKFIDKLFDGLDKVYQLHHKLGQLGLISILLHLLTLIISRLPIPDISLYILPSNSFTYTLGVLSLYQFCILVVISINRKISYDLWKITHKFLSIPLFTSFLHALLVPSDISSYLPLKLYIIALVILAILSDLYIKIIYPNIFYSSKIVEVVKKDRSIVIRFKKPNDFIYKPGQFVFVSFINKDISNEEHPFTLSSSPQDEMLEIIIRTGTDYTQTLTNLNIDDSVKIHGPFGQFHKALKKEEKQLWIAGGIGITPYISAVKSNNYNERTKLHYLIKDLSDSHLTSEFNNLNVEIHTDTNKLEKSILLSDIKRENYTEVLLCGPSRMVEDFNQYLLNNGIKKSNIHYEIFNF